MTAAALRKFVLSLDGVTEVPHFEKRAFRTTRRMFASLSPDERSLNVGLTPDHQAALAGASNAFAKIANKWGDQGWTSVALDEAPAALVREALREAHAAAAPVVKPAPKAVSAAKQPVRRGRRKE